MQILFASSHTGVNAKNKAALHLQPHWKYHFGMIVYYPNYCMIPSL